MKLDKAIENLDSFLHASYGSIDDDLEVAVTLAIEALKRLQRNRGDFFQPSSDLLPGETEE